MGYPAIKWTAELEQSIIDWIADGKTLREFCRQPDTPSFDAVYDHEKLSDDFKQRIACARESGEHQISQECIDIADNAVNDWMERHNKDGDSIGWELNGEHVQRSKLRIETRLKLLAKWNPRKWGDKLQVEGDLKVTRLILRDEAPALPGPAPVPEFDAE